MPYGIIAAIILLLLIHSRLTTDDKPSARQHWSVILGLALAAFLSAVLFDEFTVAPFQNRAVRLLFVFAPFGLFAIMLLLARRRRRRAR